MKAIDRKVGEIHPNGKWVWTEYKSGKFDWRAIKKGTTENPKEEKKSTKKEKAKKLTPAQQAISDKYEEGYRTMCCETRTKAGYVNVWVKKNNDGKWEVVEEFTTGESRAIDSFEYATHINLRVKEDKNTVYGHMAQYLHGRGVIGATAELIRRG